LAASGPGFQFLRKVANNAVNRIGGGLAQAANGGIAHDGRKLPQQRYIPSGLIDQGQGFGGTGAAGRALPTAFMHENRIRLRAMFTALSA